MELLGHSQRELSFKYVLVVGVNEFFAGSFVVCYLRHFIWIEGSHGLIADVSA